MIYQYCPDDDKMVNEIKKELTDQVISIRENILKNIAVIDYLLKTSAAKEYTIGSLLRGRYFIIPPFQ